MVYGAGGAPGQSAAGFRRLAVTGYVRTAMVMLSFVKSTMGGTMRPTGGRPLAQGPLLDAQLKDGRIRLRVRAPEAPRRGVKDRVTREHETTRALAMRPLPVSVAQAPRLDSDPVFLAERTTQDDGVALVHHRSYIAPWIPR